MKVNEYTYQMKEGEKKVIEYTYQMKEGERKLNDCMYSWKIQGSLELNLNSWSEDNPQKHLLEEKT